MNQTAEVIKFERPVVKADIENGYDRLAHDITDAFTKNPAKLSGCEFQIIFAIIGKTYRWQKKSDWIANSQLCEKTGMLKGHVSKVIKSLIAKNVIVKKGKEIGLNAIVSEWGVVQKSPKVTQSGNNKKLPNRITEVTQLETKVTQSDNNSYPITPPQKKKETNLSLPTCLNLETWESWIDYRDEIKKPYKLTSAKTLLKEISKWGQSGISPEQVINHSIMNGYQGLFPDKFKPTGNFKVQPENFQAKDYGQSTFAPQELTHD